MAQIVKFHGYGIKPWSGTPEATGKVVAGVAGRGDTAPLTAKTGNPNVSIEPKITIDAPSGKTAAYAPPDGLKSPSELPPYGTRVGVSFRAYNAANGNNLLNFRFVEDTQPVADPYTPISPLTAYSARFYFAQEEDLSVIAGSPLMFRFRDSTASLNRFELRLSKFVFLQSTHMRPFFLGLTTPVAPALSYRVVYRVEIQVDYQKNPRVVVRIFRNDEVTPVRWTLQCNPTSVTADTLVFGNEAISGDPSQFIPKFQIWHIEAWDNYTADGQFSATPLVTNPVQNGSPYVPPSYHWFEWDGATTVPLSLKKWNGSALVTDTQGIEVPNTSLGVTCRNVVVDSYTSETYVYADRFDGSHNVPSLLLDVHTPSRPAPEGGWPCLVYTHGGFFGGGGKALGSPSSIYDGFLGTFINAGYAVASIEYSVGYLVVYPMLILGGYAPGTLDHVPNFPGEWQGGTWRDGGRYPSFVVECKLAGRWLQMHGQSTINNLGGTPTFLNINPNRLISAGFSAGGYIALGAAISRDITDDGHPTFHRNLTVNHPEYGVIQDLNGDLGTGPGLPDPTYIGAMVWHAPTDMQLAYDYDPTHPDGGPMQNHGILRSTAGIFTGYPPESVVSIEAALPNSSLMNMIEIQRANGDLSKIPPVFFTRGGSDYLVHWEHEQVFGQSWNDTYLGSGADPVPAAYTRHVNPSYHDYGISEYNAVNMIEWLRSIE